MRQSPLREPHAPKGWFWYSNLIHFRIGTGQGLVDITVNDAVTGSPIAGATVTASGGGGTQTTDASGKTSFELDEGATTFAASAAGYITVSSTVTVVAGENTAATISLPPVGQANTFRIVLNWGAEPRDLDLHITGPSANGSRFHIYYANPNRDPADPTLPTLDHDITTGLGPRRSPSPPRPAGRGCIASASTTSQGTAVSVRRLGRSRSGCSSAARGWGTPTRPRRAAAPGKMTSGRSLN